jgi:hypothetical protein
MESAPMIASNGRIISDRAERILPLRRAESLTNVALYWIPAQLGRMPDSQRGWLSTFYRGFHRSSRRARD